MNNLKRVLSLGLTGAMLSGMMMVGASAASKDFGDKDEIKNTVAVETLTALNVIGGDQAGNFNPKGNLTRAEMAKLAVYVLNGGKEPVLGTKTVPTFSDIDGHWGEKYIEYCAAPAINIIGGMGDGTFAPNGTLTVAQAAKMLLVAMGYEPTVFGFKGADWAMNVNIEANKAGLYENLDNLGTDDIITRDEAAQMMFNAVNANMMKVVKSHNANGTSETYEPYSPKKTLLETKFDVITTDAAVLKATAKDSKGTYTLLTSGDDSKDEKKKDFTKVEMDCVDLLGQSVQVIYKKGHTDQVFGVFATDDNVVVEGLVNQISAIKADSLKLDDVKYDTEGLTVITDGAWATGTVTGGIASYDTVKLIDNDNDEKYEVAVVTTMTPGKVGYVDAKEITVGGVSYKFADHDIAEDLAKDDYVVISNNIAKKNKTIDKVEKLNGKVTAEKTHSVEINGVWYNDDNANMDLGKTYDFYAVNGVAVKATKVEDATVSNLVMLLKDDTTGLAHRARILDAKGNKSIVDVAGYYQANGTSTASAANGALYTYTETDDGYKFCELPADAAKLGDYTVRSSSVIVEDADEGMDGKDPVANFDQSTNEYAINDDAVIFVYDAKDTTGNGKVITGKQLKNLKVNSTATNAQITSAGAVILTKDFTGLEKVTYARVETKSLTGLTVIEKNANYGFITTDAYNTDVAGDAYAKYTMWDGNDYVTVLEKGATVGNRTAGTIVRYDSIDADKVITGVEAENVQTTAATGKTFTAYIQAMDGKTLYLDGLNQYKLTDDTIYMYIDSNAKADKMGMKAIDLELAFHQGAYYRDNVIVKADANGNIAMIIVDVKNNMTAAANKTVDFTVANAPAKVKVNYSGNDAAKAGDAVEITNVTTGDVTVAFGNDAFAKVGGDLLTGGSNTITIKAHETVVVYLTGVSDNAYMYVS